MRVLILCAAGLTGFGQATDPLSLQREVAVGEQVLGRANAVFENTAIQQYITGLGTKLAAGLPDSAPAFPYRFPVVPDTWPSDDTHEPKVLPGGIVLVPTGLILAVRNETELAGMIAHSLAHSAGRHGLGTRDGVTSFPVMFVGSGLTPPGMLPTKRKFEVEADREAVRLMASAGYDPEALASYVGRVQKPAVGALARSFALHAPTEERAAAIRSAALGLSVAESALSVAFENLQDELSKQVARQPDERPTLKRRP